MTVGALGPAGAGRRRGLTTARAARRTAARLLVALALAVATYLLFPSAPAVERPLLRGGLGRAGERHRAVRVPRAEDRRGAAARSASAAVRATPPVFALRARRRSTRRARSSAGSPPSSRPRSTRRPRRPRSRSRTPRPPPGCASPSRSSSTCETRSVGARCSRRSSGCSAAICPSASRPTGRSARSVVRSPSPAPTGWSS